MKVVKSIGLFFVLALFLLVIGYYLTAAIWHSKPEKIMLGNPEQELLQETPRPIWQAPEETTETLQDNTLQEGFLEASALEGKLAKDAQYVVEEVDVLRGTVLSTNLKLPEKYVGMDLQQFTQAMNLYAYAPPLSERQRGFEGLEVRSFSRERVVVRMNYRYVQPGEAFYLALEDHEIVVLLEDGKTLYMHTGIMADRVEPELLLKLNEMIYVEDEAALYDLLESYSS